MADVELSEEQTFESEAKGPHCVIPKRTFLIGLCYFSLINATNGKIKCKVCLNMN